MRVSPYPCSHSNVHLIKISDYILFLGYLPAVTRSFTGSRVSVQLYSSLYTLLYSCTVQSTVLYTRVKYSRPGTASFSQYLSSFQDMRICVFVNLEIKKNCELLTL